MVFKCCAPNCRGNYDSDNKVSVFKFPSNPSLLHQWIRALKREKSFQPTKNNRVSINIMKLMSS